MGKHDFDWGRLSSVIFCALVGAFLLWAIFRYLFAVLLPFIVAALIAYLARLPAKKIAERTRLSPRVVSAALVFIILAVFTLACSFAVRRLISELGSLASGIGDDGNALREVISKLVNLTDGIGIRIAGFLRLGKPDDVAELGVRIDNWLSGLFSGAMNSVSSRIPGLISSIVGAIPGLLLGLTVTVISSFYFALDRDKITAALTSLLPPGTRKLMPHIKREAAYTAASYLKAYSLIFLMTFAEIFFGLTIIGVDYSFIIALITAVVDVLPVLGVGTVLIPWAVICLATGEISRGVGLIVLYVAAVVIRQFTEPRILGGNLGIHPLLTLFSMFIGFRLFGIVGMLGGPLLITGIRIMLPLLSPSGESEGNET